jgi:magnesium-transporting ATPase (P-type)
LALILWLAAALALFAEYANPGQGMAALGFAILGVIPVNGIFSFWQEYSAERATAALRRLLPQQAKAVRDGTVMQTEVGALVPGRRRRVSW